MDETRRSENGEVVQIEEIMEAIRRHLAQREQTGSPPSTPEGPLPTAFYEHLNQARLAHDRIEPRIQVTSTDVPIIGPLLHTMRHKLHELILFYVNQLAANQIRFNAHMLQALTILSQELEKNDHDQK